jgi:uncharacterized protein YjeT (DUF2065 family)
MSTLILALGLVCILEGLVLVLAPSRLEDILRLLEEFPVEKRRLLGWLAVTSGAILLWLAAMLGA